LRAAIDRKDQALFPERVTILPFRHAQLSGTIQAIYGKICGGTRWR